MAAKSSSATLSPCSVAIRAVTFGEHGRVGGVSQVMEGMQEKFGEVRVSDTGIREAASSDRALCVRGLHC